jgi:heme exporter protein D
MDTVAHLDFIAAAYAAAVFVVAGLIVWVTLDYRAQRRALAELQMEGFTRRSAPPRSGRAMEQAEEQV